MEKKILWKLVILLIQPNRDEEIMDVPILVCLSMMTIPTVMASVA
jgi:hypothetical protein